MKFSKVSSFESFTHFIDGEVVKLVPKHLKRRRLLIQIGSGNQQLHAPATPLGESFVHDTV